MSITRNVIDDQLLGFVTTVKDGETAVGYYIGFDRRINADIPIYFRLLNLIVHGLLHTIDDHEEPPKRNPFK